MKERKKRTADYFDPKRRDIPYPEFTDGHYIPFDDSGIGRFDREYPYIDRSPGFRLLRGIAGLLMTAIVFPATRVHLGLRVRGRRNLRKYKKELRGGAISCSNHVAMWDFLAVSYALRPRKMHVPVLAANVSGIYGPLVRMAGGIPLPEENVHATIACQKQIGELLKQGGWLHIYPEGSLWEYYAPIRPFKPGAAYFACRYEKPLLPMAFSYRRAGVLRRRIFHQPACYTLSIGTPLYPDDSLPMAERQEDLLRRAHASVCILAGIPPEKNLYPPIFHHNEKIEEEAAARSV